LPDLRRNLRELNGNFVRTADLGAGKMLRDARMAGLVKLRCGNGDPGQGRLRAGSDGQRCLPSAARATPPHGRFEPFVHDAAVCLVAREPQESRHWRGLRSPKVACPNRPGVCLTDSQFFSIFN
jgi:hypothetical protein